MKLGHNYFECEWCGEKFNAIQKKSSNIKGQIGRKGAVSNQIRCPKCWRLVRQR